MPTHLHLVSSETIQTLNIGPQLVWGQLQLVEGRLEHYVGRTSLVYKDAMHLPSCYDYRNHYRVIIMGYDILEIDLGEDKVDVGSLIYLPDFHRHHLSRVLLPLGGSASSRGGVDLPMNGHLVRLIRPCGHQRLVVLLLLKVIL